MLKKLPTSKGDYWIKQLFNSIVFYFIMGTSLIGKNLLPEGAILSFKSCFLWRGKSLLPQKVTLLNVTIFITYMRNCLMGATPTLEVHKLIKLTEMGKPNTRLPL